MDILGLRQNGSYRLIFPITANGDPVSSVDAAQFSIYGSASRAPIYTANLCNGVEFADSSIIVPLESSATAGLVGNVKYELWVMDSSARPIAVRDGIIEFKPTNMRITTCL